MSTEDELREQMLSIFEKADYPISSPLDLLPVLPNGPSTKFEADDISFTAMELNTRGAGKADFPYESAEEFVDDIIEGMKDEGVL